MNCENQRKTILSSIALFEDAEWPATEENLHAALFLVQQISGRAVGHKFLVAKDCPFSITLRDVLSSWVRNGLLVKEEKGGQGVLRAALEADAWEVPPPGLSMAIASVAKLSECMLRPVACAALFVYEVPDIKAEYLRYMVKTLHPRMSKDSINRAIEQLALLSA